jgi:predicted phosphodiesterase
MNQRSAIRIGVITDTHGLFDPAIRRHFRGVDHILHAGDIGDRSVIEQLEQIAPVTPSPATSMMMNRADIRPRP